MYTQMIYPKVSQIMVYTDMLSKHFRYIIGSPYVFIIHTTLPSSPISLHQMHKFTHYYQQINSVDPDYTLQTRSNETHFFDKKKYIYIKEMYQNEKKNNSILNMDLCKAWRRNVNSALIG